MLKSGIKWMFIILGAMIGAGYASGRELWQFFGEESGLAIIIFTVLFIISSYIVMKIGYEEKTEHFLPILQKLVGKKIATYYDVIIIFYLFTTTVIMLAGGGSTGELFHIPYTLGILFISAILVIVFIWNIKGLVSLNYILIPILVVGLTVTLLFFISNGHSILSFRDWNKQSNWPSSFTFTALNVLSLIAVIGAIGKEIKNKGEAWIASIGSGLILGGVSFIYNEVLIEVSSELVLYDIPLFAIIKDFPYSAIILMSILLWLAVVSTAASGLFGLTARIREYIKLPLWLTALLLLVIIVPLTKLGFSFLIAVLYPIFAVLNLYLLVAIMVYPIANRYKWE
ncbi:YkvI family membrane protein [Bacillus suaedaesalsae]|uniref:Membrane protein YkvI n=1 Tax=Bacillus suaedaesalsae TaxID=2810349 RepID=A0ABS2DEN8_9BACI|nr:hypothetical protein [Bacillus suaedaesalsae]MBM6616924.1 hypothetical protein [Bacillus suaedaesalsae]